MSRDSQAAALEAGRRTYTSTTPCLNGHVGLRYTANGTCMQCTAARTAAAGQARRQAEREKLVEAMAEAMAKAEGWSWAHLPDHPDHEHPAAKTRCREYWRALAQVSLVAYHDTRQDGRVRHGR